MKIQLTIAAALALMLGPASHAQAAAAASKVGIINMQEVIASTAEGKQAAAELQSQFAPRQTELQNMQKTIEDDQTRLRTGATTLSDDEKIRIQREGDTLTRAYQRKQQEASDDLNDAQQDVVNRIGRKAIDVINKYARDGGYAVILDTSSQQTPVVYAANQNDVTQDIIRLYDQTYPVKAAAAAAAPRPATPKPAAPAPKPQ